MPFIGNGSYSIGTTSKNVRELTQEIIPYNKSLQDLIWNDTSSTTDMNIFRANNRDFGYLGFVNDDHLYLFYGSSNSSDDHAITYIDYNFTEKVSTKKSIQLSTYSGSVKIIGISNGSVVITCSYTIYLMKLSDGSISVTKMFDTDISSSIQYLMYDGYIYGFNNYSGLTRYDINSKTSTQIFSVNKSSASFLISNGYVLECYDQSVYSLSDNKSYQNITIEFTGDGLIDSLVNACTILPVPYDQSMYIPYIDYGNTGYGKFMYDIGGIVYFDDAKIVDGDYGTKTFELHCKVYSPITIDTVYSENVDEDAHFISTTLHKYDNVITYWQVIPRIFDLSKREVYSFLYTRGADMSPVVTSETRFVEPYLLKMTIPEV